MSSGGWDLREWEWTPDLPSGEVGYEQALVRSSPELSAKISSHPRTFPPVCVMLISRAESGGLIVLMLLQSG